MADITTYPLVRHLRGTPTLHVRHLRRGQLVHDGTGLAFFFRPLSAVLSEVVVVVGQDGLVANLARYVDGQPVIGINPEPERNPGVLVPHPPAAASSLLAAAASSAASLSIEDRSMVEALVDNGQRLVGLNEVFIGQPTHQTARYTLAMPGLGPAGQRRPG